MKLAIMQPYLFPYLGYYQLIRAVDAFVVYDDVNYIKGGWINRNFILSQDRPQRVTLSLKDASPNRLISQVFISPRRDKFLKTIRQTYSKAPHFAVVFPMIEKILMQKEENLALFLNWGLRQTCEYLGIHPEWYLSSEIKKDNSLRGEEKVLAICEELGATHYLNAPGGKNLYSRDKFESRGVRLSFVQPKSLSYRQFRAPFMPNLSIIDVLMFNDFEQCKDLLEEYELV